MFDFTKIVENVPDYTEFLTVDEMDANSQQLAKDHPDVVSVKVAGYSRKGHPILCLKIGSGSKNAFFFGCPHPNEPIGAMTVEYFSKALAEDREFLESTDYTWYMIKSIDPDGTKLNEGWFKGPFSLTNYLTHYFRPASYEQAEWTFPIKYKEYEFTKTIPETKVLMDIIEEVKPDFMYSLHNAGFGGTYWYISKDMPQIWEGFYEATKKRDIPLHLGEPEINFITPFGQAIYPMPNTKEVYDYQEEYSEKSPAETMESGDSSAGYVETLGLNTVTLVTEMPYFTEPRIQSDKLMDFTRKEAALKALDVSRERALKLKEVYEPVQSLMSDDNPFSKMTDMVLKHNEDSYKTQKKFIESSKDYDELCKESEAFDNLEIPKFYALFYWGNLRRGCDYELEKGVTEGKDLIVKTRDLAQAEFDRCAAIAEADLDYTVIPIKALVQVQLESGLLVASNL